MVACKILISLIWILKNNVKNSYSYNNLLMDAPYKNLCKYDINRIECRRSKCTVFVGNWKQVVIGGLKYTAIPISCFI